MIEILVTMVVLAIGLLGMAGLMLQSQRSDMESYQRAQALILLQDMYERINTNRNAANCYAYTNAATGAPFLGTGGTIPARCTPTGTQTAAQINQVTADLTAWNVALQGNAEQQAAGGVASNVGAMKDGRGCISYDNTNLLPDFKTGAALAGTGTYTLSVAWQGLGKTFANTNLLCATGLYDNEKNRRIVTLTFKIGAINNQ